jgi:protein gp37
MKNSKIEWTGSSWNPVTGCTKISAGCKNCYAERMAKRLKAMGQPNYKREFRISLHDHAIDLPLNWKKPTTIFVNSMSDLFHEDIPLSFIQKVFEVMNLASWHTFQVLTKRSARMVELADELRWSPNIWMGVSVENEDYLERMDHLRDIPSAVRFISFEPLIGRVGKVNLTRIDWVIVGGESGPKARPMNKEWADEIKDQCIEACVPFFFKQWGGTNKKKTGRLLDGKIWNQMPLPV